MFIVDSASVAAASPARHPATLNAMRWFKFDHLPEDLKPISRAACDYALEMMAALPDGPELSAGLRKLLEAKDCFVRAAVDRGIGS